MVKHKNKFPERGELVLGRIKTVNPFSVLVELEEYPGVEGMVHISEVANKWIRNIREFVKVGQKKVLLVLRIDSWKGHVNLSLKKVSKNQADRRLQEAKREQRAEKMMETIGRELKLNLDEMYEQIGFILQEGFGEIFKAFESSTTEQGRKLLERKGVSDKWIKLISEVAEKSLEDKELDIKLNVKLISYEPNGVEVIKGILKSIEKDGVNINYISAPEYSLSLKTKNAKEGEKLLRKTAEKLISGLGKNGKGEIIE